MYRDSLDAYDVLPEDMIAYLSNYGRHFNKKLLKFAVSHMSIAKGVKLTPMTKEEVDNLLAQYNIALQNNTLSDYIYVANMGKADFLGKSIPDAAHLALYIKDVIDDPDSYDGCVFNRWYADTRHLGIPIDWEDML